MKIPTFLFSGRALNLATVEVPLSSLLLFDLKLNHQAKFNGHQHIIYFYQEKEINIF